MTLDRTYRDDPYEYMSQEPCDYCPYQNTNTCADCYYLWNTGIRQTRIEEYYERWSKRGEKGG